MPSAYIEAIYVDWILMENVKSKHFFIAYETS